MESRPHRLALRLGKSLHGFLLEIAHRTDVRARAVADTRDAELRQLVIRAIGSLSAKPISTPTT